MLRICNLAGESLATFSADEVEGKSVKELKISLAKQIGATRFQQRWLTQDHTELQDDSVVPCCDVQLVVLDFVRDKEDEVDQLYSACQENRPDKLFDLLRKPLNPDGFEGCMHFLDSLHWAASFGHAQIVQLLLDAGIEAGMPLGSSFFGHDCEEWGALHFAAQDGHSEVAKLLLERGADKDLGDSDGLTALHLAASRGHAEVVKVLLEAGADKNAAKDGGKTALHLAAMTGRSEVVKLLLMAGTDKDACDIGVQRWTVLHWAAQRGHAEVLTLLLEAGADKDAASTVGTTALHTMA